MSQRKLENRNRRAYLQFDTTPSPAVIALLSLFWVSESSPDVDVSVLHIPMIRELVRSSRPSGKVYTYGSAEMMSRAFCALVRLPCTFVLESAGSVWPEISALAMTPIALCAPSMPSVTVWTAATAVAFLEQRRVRTAICKCHHADETYEEMGAAAPSFAAALFAPARSLTIWSLSRLHWRSPT